MAKTKRRQKKKAVACPKWLAALLALALVLIGLDQSSVYTLEDWQSLAGNKPAAGDEDFSVHFIDVGQGDCTYIHCGDADVLIDAGEAEYGDTVVQYLHSQNVQSLDYVIATHPHSDHIGGLPAVLTAFPTGALLTSAMDEDDVPTTNSYENLLNALDKANVPLQEVTVGETFDLDGASLKILGPRSAQYDDLNNYSVVAQLTYGTQDFLLTGDMSKEAENELLDAGALSRVEVLKVGHHGSSTSSTKKFLKAVAPDYAVIMCGDNNSYNHPNEKTVERLMGYTNNIYRTDLQGTIVFTSDGTALQVTLENGG